MTAEAIKAEIEEIASIFRTHMRAHSTTPRDLSDIAYLLDLIRNAPMDITHGGHNSNYEKMISAVETLQEVLPDLIDRATSVASEAKRSGRATGMDALSEKAGDLLRATEPFRHLTTQKRDHRARWHGWARLLRVAVATHLDSGGGGFSGPDTRGTLIVKDLLARAGIFVNPAALVAAIN